MPPVSKVTPLPQNADRPLVLGARIAVPAHDDRAPGAHAALRHAQEGAHAQLRHLLLVEDFDLHARRRQPLAALGQSLGVDDVGRLGHQVARETDRVGEMLERREGFTCPGDVGHQDGERLQAGLLLLLLARAVLVEAIGAQASSTRNVCRHVRRRQRRPGQVFDRERTRRLADTVEMADQIAAQCLQARRVELFDLAKPDQDDPRHRQAFGRHDVQHIVLAALEAARPHGAGQDTARLLVESGRRGRHFAVFQHTDHVGPGSGRLWLGKRDFHGRWPRDEDETDGASGRVETGRNARPRDFSDFAADEKGSMGG